jgi:ABC-type branched-subunit amino acid transport system substrate-binding protein
MKHTALFIFLSIITVASSQSNAEDTKSHDFTIGVSIPLTGDLAEYGSAVRNGIEFAKSRFHGEFEHIHLIFEDNRYDGKTSLTIFQKFQARNVALIYSWGERSLERCRVADKQIKDPSSCILAGSNISAT